MLLDNVTLLVAVGVSSVAMMSAMVIGWIGSRKDSYLVSWALGMAVVVLGLVILAQSSSVFVPMQQFGAYMTMLTGIAVIYCGARQFGGRLQNRRIVLMLWAPAASSMLAAYLLGFSGIGTIIMNGASAVFMMLCARQYWSARAENFASLATTAGLYALTSLSFIACSAVLLFNGQWTLYGAPDNWAETLNSIMAIIALSGIGALSLTLNQSRTAQRHRQEAMTDPLTNLLNRRALFDNLGENSLKTGTAVLMFDLDYFKQINDRFGHAVGDRVIQHFAAILLENTRKDDLVARLGGEEFCVVVEGVPAEVITRIAERIRSSFSERNILATPGMHPTVSIGLALAGEEEHFPSALSRADNALYGAKRGGRNRVQAAALRDAA